MAEPGPQLQGIPLPNHLPLPVDPPEPHTLEQPAHQMVHLNGSHFKPEFSGKPDEDAEAHLLYTNDWMRAHHFVEGARVQRICLTL